MKRVVLLKALALLGLGLIFTGLNASQAEAAGYCREFTQTVTVGGRLQSGYGTACMQPDGSWQIVSQGNLPQVPSHYRAPEPVQYVIIRQQRVLVSQPVVYYNQRYYRSPPPRYHQQPPRWSNSRHHRHQHSRYQPPPRRGSSSGFHFQYNHYR